MYRTILNKNISHGLLFLRFGWDEKAPGWGREPFVFGLRTDCYGQVAGERMLLKGMVSQGQQESVFIFSHM